MNKAPSQTLTAVATPGFVPSWWATRPKAVSARPSTSPNAG
jgi:hypothetical protein